MNEEANIAATANKTSQVLSRLASEYEVIAVNDGSTDRTAEVVREASKKDPHLKPLRRISDSTVGRLQNALANYSKIPNSFEE